jgi:hypothetical protein
MRPGRILLLLFCHLAFSCNSIRVITHYNENSDFSKFHSFKTVNDIERPGNTGTYTEYLDLDRAIAAKMIERKYTEETDADLGVHYRIILNKKIDYNYNRDRLYPYTNYETYGRKYTEGVLIIEMRDRDTRKVVWQASLDLKINKRKKLENVIEDTIDFIFSEYPFEAGSKKPVIQER